MDEDSQSIQEPSASEANASLLSADAAWGIDALEPGVHLRDCVVETFKENITASGGCQQYLNARFATVESKKAFVLWLCDTFPEDTSYTYHKRRARSVLRSY